MRQCRKVSYHRERKIQKKKQIILATKFSQGGTKLHFETSGGPDEKLNLK